MVKWRDIDLPDAHLLVRQERFAKVRIGLGPARARLHDRCAELAELADHEVGGAGGHDDGGGTRESGRGGGAGEACVSARGAGGMLLAVSFVPSGWGLSV